MITKRDLEKLEKENVIGKDEAVKIESYMAEKKKSLEGMAKIYFSIIMVMLVVAGIYMILKDTSFFKENVVAVSFVPMLIAMANLLYAVFKKKDNVYNEVATTFVFFTTGIVLAVADSQYVGIESIYYIMLWIATGVALTYAMKSKVSLILTSGVLIALNEQLDSYYLAYSASILSLIPYIILYLKEKIKVNSIAKIVYLMSVFVYWLNFEDINKYLLLITGLGFVAICYFIDREEKEFSIIKTPYKAVALITLIAMPIVVDMMYIQQMLLAFVLVIITRIKNAEIKLFSAIVVFVMMINTWELFGRDVRNFVPALFVIYIFYNFKTYFESKKITVVDVFAIIYMLFVLFLKSQGEMEIRKEYLDEPFNVILKVSPLLIAVLIQSYEFVKKYKWYVILPLAPLFGELIAVAFGDEVSKYYFLFLVLLYAIIILIHGFKSLKLIFMNIGLIAIAIVVFANISRYKNSAIAGLLMIVIAIIAFTSVYYSKRKVKGIEK